MKLGITFSHQHASFLKLDPINALGTLTDLPFDIIRLGTYWSEIQPRKNVFDFTKIKTLLEICENKSKEVVVTLGMKAPRWPEFYVPKWINEDNKETSLLEYLSKTIEELKKYSSINYWQVENEPFDQSGPENKVVPLEFLEKEIKLVSAQDSKRKIILNLWGNDMMERKTLDMASPLADIIGIDLYYKQYYKTILGQPRYRRPQASEEKITESFTTCKKPLWITELQSEPWEGSMDEHGYFSEKPKSISPYLMEKNFESACKCRPEAILFWGAEYWLWREKMGDNNYLKTISELISNKSKKIG